MTQVFAVGGFARRHPSVVMLGLLAIGVAALVVIGLGTGRAAGFHDDTTCDDAPDGYACVPLVNKGNPEDVGELFFAKQGDMLTLLVRLDELSSTGLTGQKLCLDDDDDPWASETSCLGGTAKTKISRSSYNLADPGDPPEESAGMYEYMLEGAALGSEGSQCVDEEGSLVACAAGVSGPFARYDVEVGEYSFFSFHFNQSLSIEGFFQEAATIDCGETVTVEDGDTIGSFTRLQNVDDATCTPKPYTAAADDSEGTIAFLPQGDDQLARYLATLTFVESGDAPVVELTYDQLGGDTFEPVLNCEDIVFDGEDFVSATLPDGESWCLLDIVDYEPGPTVEGQQTWTEVFLVYGEDDPKFR